MTASDPKQTIDLGRRGLATALPLFHGSATLLDAYGQGEALGPFEFIILFFSFIYTLALTHLLLAAAQIIRRRRSVVFSWPHGLWMLNALLLLLCNWISLWDFHQLKSMTLPVILGGFALVGVMYLICALIAPDFDSGEDLDLRAFHEREGRTYMLAFLTFLPLAFILNIAAGAAAGIQSWAAQNAIVLVMAPPILLPLLVRARWAQIGGPFVLVGAMAAYLVIYYPVIR